MMTITLELSDQQIVALRVKATAAGVTPASYVRHMLERALAEASGPGVPIGDQQRRARAAVARIRELQKHVKPDPDGWTVGDYIDRGRP